MNNLQRLEKDVLVLRCTRYEVLFDSIEEMVVAKVAGVIDNEEFSKQVIEYIKLTNDARHLFPASKKDKESF